jgi:hypothetical protein
MRRLAITLLATAAFLVGCAAEDGADRAAERAASVALGPTDGRDLPGTDLDRVRAGDVAPDFSLVSLAGPVVTLSELRGRRNVILVFYRGWW